MTGLSAPVSRCRRICRRTAVLRWSSARSRAIASTVTSHGPQSEQSSCTASVKDCLDAVRPQKRHLAISESLTRFTRSPLLTAGVFGGRRHACHARNGFLKNLTMPEVPATREILQPTLTRGLAAVTVRADGSVNLPRPAKHRALDSLTFRLPLLRPRERPPAEPFDGAPLRAAGWQPGERPEASRVHGPVDHLDRQRRLGLDAHGLRDLALEPVVRGLEGRNAVGRLRYVAPNIAHAFSSATHHFAPRAAL